MANLGNFTFISASWVRVWGHHRTFLNGGHRHSVQLIGKQRAKIRHQAGRNHRAFRATWDAVGPVLRQLDDGNVMKRING